MARGSRLSEIHELNVSNQNALGNINVDSIRGNYTTLDAALQQKLEFSFDTVHQLRDNCA
eukprot:CAMPEP_0194398446 /NCGR_PEP_ID=MMETSP0174-20130528/126105_1 /TAXON_ID=216777 /ORGANISM="Proboscia alata, Strain PI-D3" /LENGTH=59 /DNA_ID=CAMNT_0039194737 /DNA_START=208 /DNA_END=387 /DNA_ORIENTATION=+